MMYPYMKLPDNTEIVHSELLEGNYTEDELKSFVELLRHHAHLIYRYAAEGGVNIA